MSFRSSSRGRATGVVFFFGVIAGLCLALFAAWMVDRNSLRELFVGDTKSTPATSSVDPIKDRPDLYAVLPEGENNITRVPTPVAPANRPTAAVVAVPDSGVRGATITAPPSSDPRAEALPTTQVTPQTPPQVATASPSPEIKNTRWLQVGSFTKPEDAENRRVELALSGWEATVQKTDIPNVGIRFRVRIGPFTDDAILARIKTEVERRKFATTVVQQ